MRPVVEWNLGTRTLMLGKRTFIMGVVNVTPDSFSDGGLHFDRDGAVEHALQLIADELTSLMSAANRRVREQRWDCRTAQRSAKRKNWSA